nr:MULTISPECIES: hypothetical protein [Enterobacterales]
MNNKLKSLISITLEIAFNGPSGFIEELSGIGNSDFMLSHFCNDIHGQLGFGVQRDHP